jgi:hypothetical protein
MNQLCGNGRRLALHVRIFAETKIFSGPRAFGFRYACVNAVPVEFLFQPNCFCIIVIISCISEWYVSLSNVRNFIWHGSDRWVVKDYLWNWNKWSTTTYKYYKITSMSCLFEFRPRLLILSHKEEAINLAFAEGRKFFSGARSCQK